jgi:hypothetical protein
MFQNGLGRAFLVREFRSTMPFPSASSSSKRVRIEFVFFDAGGGHRSAATALQMAIEAQSLPWEIHLFNLQEALDKIDLIKRVSGVRIQDVYNSMLKSGKTLGSKYLMRSLQAAIAAYHGKTVKILAESWRESAPDMVVSFVPHFNREICESFRRAFPGRPFVTILTDLANYPPHFWLEKQDQDFICGTEFAMKQALALGHKPERVLRASGMILHPRFYEPFILDHAAERRSLKLAPDLPTGLVMFGGQGSKVISEIVERLNRSKVNLQLILICGKNETLAASLRARQTRFPIFVEGFTKRIPYYMHLSDFFIGKPGPGSVSEAIEMHLPVIVECNAWTLPQERYNTQWIRENEVGIVVRSFRQIVPAVRNLFQNDRLAEFRENAAALPNRAVFEIPEILREILKRGAE